MPNTWHTVDIRIEYRPLAMLVTASGRRGWAYGDWTSGGAGSVRVHSNTFHAAVIDQQYLLTGNWIYFSGYGNRSYTPNASKWVPGWYKINSVDLMTGELVLATSPTPSGTGAEGVAYLGQGVQGYTLNVHRFTMWIDGVRATNEFTNKMSAVRGNGQQSGLNQMWFNLFRNGTDPNYVNPDGDGLAWIGDVTTSGQPIPYKTADSSRGVSAPPSGGSPTQPRR
jgi:hypothetical protein